MKRVNPSIPISASSTLAKEYIVAWLKEPIPIDLVDRNKVQIPIEGEASNGWGKWSVNVRDGVLIRFFPFGSTKKIRGSGASKTSLL